jgi:hypothetical protein
MFVPVLYLDLEFQFYSIFNDLRGKENVRFVDINGIVDHHC